MYSLTTVILAALITGLIGCVVGFLLSRKTTNSNRSGDLQKRLQEAEEALDNYQVDVTEHFARTTELVNSLNESYRDMHEHLAASALKLSTPEISRQLLADAQQQLPGHKGQALEHEHVQAPKDWAPKRQGTKGTLSEDYGLHEPEAEAFAQEETTSTDSDTK